MLAQQRLRRAPSKRSPRTSVGLNTARRQSPTPSMTPGFVSIGSTPARTTDDLPPPLMPRISTNARPSAACSRSAFRTSETALVLPKNTGACSNSNASSPRNGEPFFQTARASEVAAALRGRLSIDQPAEMVLEQNLEVARRLEGMEGGDQGSFGLVVKPLVDELVELLLLPKPLHQVLLVVEPDGRRRGLAVDEQVRLAVPAKSLDRFLELVLGAGFVARSVRALELLGQLRPETRPENRDDDVGVGRLDDLRAGRSTWRRAVRAPRGRVPARPFRCTRPAAVR